MTEWGRETELQQAYEYAQRAVIAADNALEATQKAARAAHATGVGSTALSDGSAVAAARASSADARHHLQEIERQLYPALPSDAAQAAEHTSEAGPSGTSRDKGKGRADGQDTALPPRSPSVTDIVEPSPIRPSVTESAPEPLAGSRTPADPATAPTPTSFVEEFGSRYDGHVGQVHVEPLPESVVRGVHEQVVHALRLSPGSAAAESVRAQLRDRAGASELLRNLPNLRDLRGHRFTVTVDGRERTVGIRLLLTHPRPAARFGSLDGNPHDVRVERRSQGTSETQSTESSGNVRTVRLPLTASFPRFLDGVLRSWDVGVSTTLTHNQLARSMSVGRALHTTLVVMSTEQSTAYDYDTEWQVVVHPPHGPIAELWSGPQSHGAVTVWFPQHLAEVDAAGTPLPGLADPAQLDDLPLWGTDSVRDPQRLLEEVRQVFRDELTGLGPASALALTQFLSEENLRGSLPMQRDAGILSPQLLDSRGRTLGVLRVKTVVRPGTPTHRSIAGKIQLESHVLTGVKLDGRTTVSNGIALDVSTGPSLTADRAPGHPGASAVIGGSALVKGQVRWQSSDSLALGGTGTMLHAVRSNRSHLLAPSEVQYTVTLVRPGIGDRVHGLDPWPAGLSLRVLAAEDARGQRPTGEALRSLPPELANLQSIGLTTTPVRVEGTEVLFTRAETWLRDNGYLPQGARNRVLPDEALVQAQLTNLRQLDTARSQLGLRAAVEAMVDGGHSLWFERPTPTATQRVRLRLTATKDHDAARHGIHRATLPDVQVKGVATFAMGGTQQRGSLFSSTLGAGGGLTAPLGGGHTVGGSVDGSRTWEHTRTDTVGSALNHDQFFIATGDKPSSEMFVVPTRFALDLYHGPGGGRVIRFAEQEDPGRAEADPERAYSSSTSFIHLAVPRERTLPAFHVPEQPVPEPIVRAVTQADRDLLAMTDDRGAPLPGVTRLPDDTLLEVFRASAALREAFRQIVTESYPGREAPELVEPVVSPQGLADPTAFAAAVVDAALDPSVLLARGHQILKGRYVVDGITLPGQLADREHTLEIRGVLHNPRYLHTTKQYMETGVSATDSAAQARATSTTDQFGVAVIGGFALDAASAGTTTMGMSGKYTYRNELEDSATLTSVAGASRTATGSGTHHRIGADALLLLTVRTGTRNVVANSVGVGSGREVTVAVELPRAAQFLITNDQLQRDARWFSALSDLHTPPRNEQNVPLPPRFVRSLEPGFATVTSVTQHSGTWTDGGPGREVRDRIREELTRLVEDVARGATVPGHSSYLPGVASRIADYTSPTGLRALPGRGPSGDLRFHFLHTADTGARLVEVSLTARPRDGIDLSGVRGRRAAGGLEQYSVHSPSGVARSSATTTQHSLAINPTARYVRPADDTRTDRSGPAVNIVSTRAHGSKAASAAEDRYWLRTDSAADFDLEYEFVLSARSRPVADWPPNLVGGMVQNGIVTWQDTDGTGTHSWFERVLAGSPYRSATVPATVGLRFTGSEAAEPDNKSAELTPSSDDAAPEMKGARFVPTGPTPVFGFNASEKLTEALDAVAPGGAANWRSLAVSTSAEGRAARLGELVQAGQISLDRPRIVGGLTERMPGSHPFESAPATPPSLTIALYNPRRITSAKDVTIDRLQINSVAGGSWSNSGDTAGVEAHGAFSTEDANRRLFGFTIPVISNQPVVRGAAENFAGVRRNWLKTGNTNAPTDGSGVRTFEVEVDAHITVAGPNGTRHITGTLNARLSEHDVLGHGITPARAQPRVYDLPSMVGAAAEAAARGEGQSRAAERAKATAGKPAGAGAQASVDRTLRDWTTHPLEDLPSAIVSQLHPDDHAAQLWLALGADGQLHLGRALFIASHTARTAERPVELVLRGEDGLRLWNFGPDGQLLNPGVQGDANMTVDDWQELARTHSPALVEAAVGSFADIPARWPTPGEGLVQPRSGVTAPVTAHPPAPVTAPASTAPPTSEPATASASTAPPEPASASASVSAAPPEPATVTAPSESGASTVTASPTSATATGTHVSEAPPASPASSTSGGDVSSVPVTPQEAAEVPGTSVSAGSVPAHLPGRPQDTFHELLDRVNALLRQKGDARVADIDQLVRAFEKLHDVVRRRAPLPQITTEITNILQSGEVPRVLGGSPTLTQEPVVETGTVTAEQGPVAGPSGTSWDKGKGRADGRTTPASMSRQSVPTPAQATEPMRPPSPAIPAAFFDEPRPPMPTEVSAAGEHGGRAEELESSRQTSPPLTRPEPEDLETARPTQEWTDRTERPGGGPAVVGDVPGQARGPLTEPGNGLGEADLAGQGDHNRSAVVGSSGVLVDGQARSDSLASAAEEIATSGGSGIGASHGTVAVGQPDPLELVRREFEEAKTAMAKAAMTLREKEAAAALAGGAGTAGCELSVAQAHAQNTADRFNRAKQLQQSFFGV
ncbi:hypothetical protein ACWCPF_37875 [Streptomyces sp. NPDC001858]